MVKLYNADCLSAMKEIEDKSVDLILCDLPYGTTNCAWDVIIPFELLWEQYNRIIKDNGTIVLFGSEPFTSLIITSQLDKYKYSWVWVKNRATGHMLSKVKPMKRHEDICVFSKGTMDSRGKAENIVRYYPQGTIKASGGTYRIRKDNFAPTVFGERDNTHSTVVEQTNYPDDILNFDIEMRELRYHPTQKPVKLLEYLIKTYTTEGDVVLDNCMGSGSTGVACINTNREFIGIELDNKYFKIAEQRITTHTEPLVKDALTSDKTELW